MGTHQVKIVKLGFYIKDTYDFNDDQPLGYWSDDGVTLSVGPGSVAVENKSFRDWRARFNHGGDFMLFSCPAVIQIGGAGQSQNKPMAHSTRKTHR